MCILCAFVSMFCLFIYVLYTHTCYIYYIYTNVSTIIWLLSVHESVNTARTKKINKNIHPGAYVCVCVSASASACFFNGLPKTASSPLVCKPQKKKINITVAFIIQQTDLPPTHILVTVFSTCKLKITTLQKKKCLKIPT